MTRFDTYAPGTDLQRSLAGLIYTHGLARVLIATLRSRRLVVRGTTNVAPRELSNHLRRDIGLTPTATSPPRLTRFP